MLSLHFPPCGLQSLHDFTGNCKCMYVCSHTVCVSIHRENYQVYCSHISSQRAPCFKIPQLPICRVQIELSGKSAPNQCSHKFKYLTTQFVCKSAKSQQRLPQCAFYCKVKTYLKYPGESPTISESPMSKHQAMVGKKNNFLTQRRL